MYLYCTPYLQSYSAVAQLLRKGLDLSKVARVPAYLCTSAIQGSHVVKSKAAHPCTRDP